MKKILTIITTALVTASILFQTAKQAVAQEVKFKLSDYIAGLERSYLNGNQQAFLRMVGNHYAPTPKDLPAPPANAQNAGWNEWMQSRLRSIMVEPVVYRDSNEPTRKSIALVYGAFSIGNSQDPFINGKQTKDGLWHSTYRQLLQNETTQDTILSWALKGAKEAFDSMPREDRAVYAEIVAHGVKYLQTLDISAERSYLERLRKKEVSKKDNLVHDETEFTKFDPRGKANPYRKLECFIVRRILDESFTKERMLTLAKRAQTVMNTWPK